MSKTKILLIEDDEDIAQLVLFHLQNSGYDSCWCETGIEAVKKTEEYLPHLIVLDIMLPGKSGLQVCSELKTNPSTKKIPIIIASAKGGEHDIVQGLELGADDYVTKPFSPQILLARIKAVLRRQDSAIKNTNTNLVRGLISIDSIKREILCKNQKLDLTYSEFELLNFLAQKPGWVFTRNQIVDAIRGESYAVTERSIDVALVGLRKKLGVAGEYIETVRGVGYRFKEDY